MQFRKVLPFVAGLIVAGVVPSIAANDESIVLTPTKLFELIEVEQKKSKSQTELIKSLRERVGNLEDFLNDANTKEGFGAKFHAIDARLNELERVVGGVQKQVTILHAKKADK